ncbi:M14 family metallopeptidase [Thalassomonas sp. M1454]|uniref:M14 family metallopeptidase n=1 Tax=Thalassomonas sp. M1454 TaxID=2594477 RepID=UPI00117CE0BB|nr:M14 family metallopeptidase [Thalassomonas sp. M1454]TRX52481.1 carboxypeptidase [Thalassomonas sp. M1454]
MNSRYTQILLILITLLLSQLAWADDSILPPIKNFQGASLELIQGADNPWQTPAEKTGLTSTPNYKDSVEYLTKLVKSDPRLTMQSLGKSPQNRDIWLVVASTDGASNAKQLSANKKPTLLIQAGIHAGEIDGKDAGLMILRDIVKGDKAHLLEQVNILFLPILNVDGHERSSEFNRVNQRGPKNMGWRTNSQNLNLNRDFAKADTIEIQILMQTINEWQPSLYFDVHVTDGEDYQYDITYGFNGEHADSPATSKWLAETFTPYVNNDLAKNGHRGNPLVFGLDSMDFNKGLFGWTAGLRFSNGWGDTRHLPTILVENHSLKPYKQRVLGTYVFIESSLKLLAKQHKQLALAVEKDSSSRPEVLTLAWDLDKKNPTYDNFLGIQYEKKTDTLTGIEYIAWTGKEKTYKDYPTFWARLPKVTVQVPKAYYIPPQYQEVISRLQTQGVKFETLMKNTEVHTTQLIAVDPSFGSKPFEGHMTASASFDQVEITTVLPKGTIKVVTDQTLGRLAVALLDPRGPDSYFSWGFFNQMFQRTEYIESYVMVPLAKKILANDDSLKKEFLAAFPEQDTKSTKDGNKSPGSLNELFASKPGEKMQWLYQRSKYHDNEYLKYPVLLSY